MLAGGGVSPSELLKTIQDHEHQADDIIRQVLTEVRRTFLTPFDRSAITDLIVAMAKVKQAAARANKGARASRDPFDARSNRIVPAAAAKQA